MKVDDVIAAINNGSVWSVHHVDEAIDDIINWNNKGEFEEVTTVDLDEHRWYTIGTMVFRVEGELMGVRGPVQLKSESMGFEDCGIKCKAFRVVEVPSVTYKRA